MSERLDGLKQRLGQLSDLAHAMSLAHWDQQTMMPPHGGEARAESLATLERISHEMFVDDETGRLLEGAAAELNGADPDDPTMPRLIALVRRQWEKARRVPPELAAELARAASVGQEAWVIARAAVGLRDLRAVPRAQLRAGAPLRRLPHGQRRLRVSLRRAARRLRAEA